MKTFGKYLVYGGVDGQERLLHPGFKTKRDAILTLASAGFERIADNLWEDSNGNQLHIEKNSKEYR